MPCRCVWSERSLPHSPLTRTAFRCCLLLYGAYIVCQCLQLSLQQRLSARQHCAVNDFDAAMSSLRSAYNSAPYTPAYGCIEDLQPGTVYLTGIDKCFRRSYSKTPSS
jgi:hypothetical protein